jgi:hypothetical protein
MNSCISQVKCPEGIQTTNQMQSNMIAQSEHMSESPHV